MNIGRFLSLSKLSRYAPTISLCLTIKPKRNTIAKNMQNDLNLTIEENVLLKLTPCIFKKPYAISRAF